MGSFKQSNRNKHIAKRCDGNFTKLNLTNEEEKGVGQNLMYIKVVN